MAVPGQSLLGARELRFARGTRIADAPRPRGPHQLLLEPHEVLAGANTLARAIREVQNPARDDLRRHTFERVKRRGRGHRAHATRTLYASVPPIPMGSFSVGTTEICSGMVCWASSESIAWISDVAAPRKRLQTNIAGPGRQPAARSQ